MSTVPVLGSYGYGEQMRAARKAKGLTQTQVGQLLGVTAQHVCDLEYERREPSERVALALSRALNVQWYKADALFRKRIEELESALRACRKPIICSVFGMPQEEVDRLVRLIDGVLKP